MGIDVRGFVRGAACLTLAIGVSVGSGQAALAAQDDSSSGDPVRGAELAMTCAACHGDDGMGHADGIPRIVGQSAAYLRTQLMLMRRSARLRADRTDDWSAGEQAHLKSMARSFSGMDSIVLDLGDQDIEDVSAYFATRQCSPSGKPPLPQPPVATRCATCHGVGGAEVSATQPSLASQQAIYLRRQLKLFRATRKIDDIDLTQDGAARYSRIMSAQARWLTDDMINELAAYFESVACK